jgi:hypothetical protein
LYTWELGIREIDVQMLMNEFFYIFIQAQKVKHSYYSRVPVSIAEVRQSMELVIGLVTSDWFCYHDIF